jgi:hypothetical protein
MLKSKINEVITSAKTNLLCWVERIRSEFVKKTQRKIK